MPNTLIPMDNYPWPSPPPLVRKKYGGETCPRCLTATKDLHEDDGLCPKCEEEWVAECNENWPL